ncbi:Electron transport complex subunit RsxG [Rubripirellula tenax]|uniref:Electron transport complex subunit RsxG n=1 Tax=Rubripirellula tenax TaxID=2528015 RepID=A0A5C6EYD0_9BACT|nr:FMN-binding protein [Rubripirellula tenax]TWU54643.1 Electron transport complex subunit RsxG [Rubripirellula tenax]
MKSASASNQRWRRFTHPVRLASVVALLWLIPSPASKPIDATDPPRLAEIRAMLGDAGILVGDVDANGMWQLKDGSGASHGSLARTLPAAKKIVGYRGPTEAMMVFDADLQITAVGLLHSADTTEHVDAVRASADFFRQFIGWGWGGRGSENRIDGVSGATLTSMALAQGIVKRIGGDRPSLIFPDDVSDAERAKWSDDSDSSQDLVRTGPYTDNIIGYQGPTELLMTLDADQRVVSMGIRTSFDNEPYVDYVRTERSFWKRFTGRTIDDLATMDPMAEGIEGVSGATMTSLAVADTVVAAANEIVQRGADESSDATAVAVRWTIADVITIATILAAALFRRLQWFRSTVGRKVWLLSVLIVIGLWAGNLISMALIAGWSAQGIAWRLAPGLASIVVVAFLVPPLTKANPYCNHLCPHGALQQLVKPTPKSRRRVSFPVGLTRWMRRLPGLTLVAGYLALIASPSIDLASWEPFHAYLFRIAGWSSIAFALMTLAASSFIPMAYCRMGCPTGRLIDYVRLSATSHRFQRSDAIVVAMLIVAVAASVSRL